MDAIIESMCVCQRVLTVSYNLMPENNWLIHNKMNIVNVMEPIILKSCFIHFPFTISTCTFVEWLPPYGRDEITYLELILQGVVSGRCAGCEILQ